MRISILKLGFKGLTLMMVQGVQEARNCQGGYGECSYRVHEGVNGLIEPNQWVNACNWELHAFLTSWTAQRC